MLKKRLACVAAVMALCGTMMVGAANYTILEKAQKAESTIYGDVQSGALTERVDSLDTLLHGKIITSGSMENRVDSLYTDVYGNTGSDLSLLAAVNMMQWKYSGQITNGSLVSRITSLEEGLDGKAATGSLSGRVSSLRSSLLGNKQFVSQAVTLPAGTVVKLKNTDALTSKTIKKNDIVHFSVVENVTVGDVVAIPSGMQCEGTVTEARKAGIFGRNGKLVITYGDVRASDGTSVPLIIGEKAKEEYKRTLGAVGASAAGAIILGPVGVVGGLFVKGNEVNIPAGTTMYTEVKTNTDVVGFSEKPVETPTTAMQTANLAAGGVAVPGNVSTTPANATVQIEPTGSKTTTTATVEPTTTTTAQPGTTSTDTVTTDNTGVSVPTTQAPATGVNPVAEASSAQEAPDDQAAQEAQKTTTNSNTQNGSGQPVVTITPDTGNNN